MSLTWRGVGGSGGSKRNMRVRDRARAHRTKQRHVAKQVGVCGTEGRKHCGKSGSPHARSRTCCPRRGCNGTQRAIFNGGPCLLPDIWHGGWQCLCRRQKGNIVRSVPPLPLVSIRTIRVDVLDRAEGINQKPVRQLFSHAILRSVVNPATH